MKFKYLTILPVFSIVMQGTAAFAEVQTSQVGDENEKTLTCVKQDAEIGDFNTYLKIKTMAVPGRPIVSAVFLEYFDNSGNLKPTELEFLSHENSISTFAKPGGEDSVTARVSLAGHGEEVTAKVFTLKNGLSRVYDCSETESQAMPKVEKQGSVICRPEIITTLWPQDQISDQYECKNENTTICVTKARWKFDGAEYVSVRSSHGELDKYALINFLVRSVNDKYGKITENDLSLKMYFKPRPALIVDDFKLLHQFSLDKMSGLANYSLQTKKVMSLEKWKITFSEKLQCTKKIGIQSTSK